MIDPTQRDRLLEHTLFRRRMPHQFRVEKFDGHRPVHRDLQCFPDLSHSAFTDGFDQPIIGIDHEPFGKATPRGDGASPV